MQPGSMNGQGHVTKARSDMTLEELHVAYDALLLDKMQVVDQKDRLFDGVLQLSGALAVVLDALENTGEYATSHGVHFVAVEARKVLTRVMAKP